MFANLKMKTDENTNLIIDKYKYKNCSKQHQWLLLLLPEVLSKNNLVSHNPTVHQPLNQDLQYD